MSLNPRNTNSDWLHQWTPGTMGLNFRAAEDLHLCAHTHKNCTLLPKCRSNVCSQACPVSSVTALNQLRPRLHKQMLFTFVKLLHFPTAVTPLCTHTQCPEGAFHTWFSHCTPRGLCWAGTDINMTWFYLSTGGRARTRNLALLQLGSFYIIIS